MGGDNDKDDKDKEQKSPDLPFEILPVKPEDFPKEDPKKKDK